VVVIKLQTFIFGKMQENEADAVAIVVVNCDAVVETSKYFMLQPQLRI